MERPPPKRDGPFYPKVHHFFFIILIIVN
jgi:hypothetical protein